MNLRVSIRFIFTCLASPSGLTVYNPHLHVLITDGCFHSIGMLTVAPAIDTRAVEQLFRRKLLKLLLSQGRITEATVALMGKWRHLAMNRIFEDPGVFDGLVR